MTKHPAVAGSFVLALVFVVGACSSNSSQVQDKIAADIKTETGVADAKVTCPKDVKATKGETFTCDATGDFAAFMKSQGLGPVNRLRFKITFIADNSFSPELDTVQLQADLGSASGASASTASSDTTSSSEDNPALSSSSSEDNPALSSSSS